MILIQASPVCTGFKASVRECVVCSVFNLRRGFGARALGVGSWHASVSEAGCVHVCFDFETTNSILKAWS